MRKILLILLAAFSLFGCMMGPNYQRPAVDTPQTWRFEDKEAKDVANTAWWEQFNDPVLNDLIQTALRENKDIKIAAARVEEFISHWEKRGGIDPDTLRQNISKINTVLKEQLSDSVELSHFIITPVGKHGSKRYGIRAEKGKIKLEV